MLEFDLLTDIIEELTGVTKEELVSRRGLRHLVELRIVCVTIMREYRQKNGLKLTVHQLGDIFNVDHSTISYYNANHYRLVSSRQRQYKILYEQIKSIYDIKIISLDKNKERIYLEKKESLEKELMMVNEILKAINKV